MGYARGGHERMDGAGVWPVCNRLQMHPRQLTTMWCVVGGQGDRVGVCVAGLDAGCMERGLACTPSSVPTFRAAIAAVEKIRFHAGELPSRGRVHVTVGHTTQVRDVDVAPQVPQERLGGPVTGLYEATAVVCALEWPLPAPRGDCCYAINDESLCCARNRAAAAGALHADTLLLVTGTAGMPIVMTPFA